MKIIFAQGNPGAHYTHTRHNIGFFIVDLFAQKHGLTFSDKPKFHAAIAEGTIGGEKVILAKPTTFYNDTGQSARAILDFYKANPATDFLAVYDELALPFGTIRTRTSGGDAGNNGVKSLNAHIGQEHARIRIGIASAQRHIVGDIDFVLGTFTPSEKNNLPKIYQQAEQFIDGFLHNNFELTKVTLSFE